MIALAQRTLLESVITRNATEPSSHAPKRSTNMGVQKLINRQLGSAPCHNQQWPNFTTLHACGQQDATTSVIAAKQKQKIGVIALTRT